MFSYSCLKLIKVDGSLFSLSPPDQWEWSWTKKWTWSWTKRVKRETETVETGNALHEQWLHCQFFHINRAVKFWSHVMKNRKRKLLFLSCCRKLIYITNNATKKSQFICIGLVVINKSTDWEFLKASRRLRRRRNPDHPDFHPVGLRSTAPKSNTGGADEVTDTLL